MTTKSQLREASLLAGYPQGMSLQQLRSFASVLDMIRDRDDRIAAARAARVELEEPAPGEWLRIREARQQAEREDAGPAYARKSVTWSGPENPPIPVRSFGGPVDPWKWDRAKVTSTGTHLHVDFAPDPDADHRRILEEERERAWQAAKDLLGIHCSCLPDAPKHVHGAGGYEPGAGGYVIDSEARTIGLTPSDVARAFDVEESYLMTEEKPDPAERDEDARAFVDAATARTEEKLQNLTDRTIYLGGQVIEPGETITFTLSTTTPAL